MENWNITFKENPPKPSIHPPITHNTKWRLTRYGPQTLQYHISMESYVQEVNIIKRISF